MTILLKFGLGVSALELDSEDGFAIEPSELFGSIRISEKPTIGGFSAEALELNANKMIIKGELYPERLATSTNPPAQRRIFNSKNWIDFIEEWLRARGEKNFLQWGPVLWGAYYLESCRFNFINMLRGLDSETSAGRVPGGMAPIKMTFDFKFIQAEPDEVRNGKQEYPRLLRTRNLPNADAGFELPGADRIQ